MTNNIVRIGDWQLQREHEHRVSASDDCDHKHIKLDDRGDVVRCQKCNVQLSAFWALSMIANDYNSALSKLAHERETLAQAKEADLHLLASRRVEKVWRSRTMVPACPHCHRGILPEDRLGSSQINRQIELRRRDVASEIKDK